MGLGVADSRGDFGVGGDGAGGDGEEGLPYFYLEGRSAEEDGQAFAGPAQHSRGYLGGHGGCRGIVAFQARFGPMVLQRMKIEG